MCDVQKTITRHRIVPVIRLSDVAQAVFRTAGKYGETRTLAGKTVSMARQL